MIKLFEDNLEIIFVGLLLMSDDLFELLNKFRLFFIFWVYLVNNLLNFLLDGRFGVFGDILFWVVVIVVIQAIRTEEFSIDLAV